MQSIIGIKNFGYNIGCCLYFKDKKTKNISIRIGMNIKLLRQTNLE